MQSFVQTLEFSGISPFGRITLADRPLVVYQPHPNTINPMALVGWIETCFPVIP